VRGDFVGAGEAAVCVLVEAVVVAGTNVCVGAPVDEIVPAVVGSDFVLENARRKKQM
jgi:hypothetical protein